jgi:hypothetical protein
MAKGICTAPDCGKFRMGHGLCAKHYYAAGYGFTPRPCKVSDCDRMTDAKSAKGLCTRHYAQYRKTGDPVAAGYRAAGRTGAEVLWERSEPAGDCILWTGAVSADGYGSVSGATWLGFFRPHRFSWFLAFGPIPDGMEIDHTCHTNDTDCAPRECAHRRCVNPDHLEVVTHKVNSDRRHPRRVA